MFISGIQIRCSYQVLKLNSGDLNAIHKYLSGKAPKVMLSHVLLQWNHMTEDDVHSSQDLLAQVLQMQAYIFCPWVWSLRMHAQSDFICGGTCEHVKNGML